MKRLLPLLAVFALLVAACDREDLITSPAPGSIVEGATVTVTGTLPDDLPLGGPLTVNGVAGTVQADRTWSVVVPHATEGYVTELEVIYLNPNNGRENRQRRAVVRGASLSDGAFSPDGVGMRVTNEGLDGLGPVIQDLAGGAFDIGGLLSSQGDLINVQNAFLTFDVTGGVYEAGFSSVDIAPSIIDNAVRTDITIEDLFVGVDLNISDGLLIDFDCKLELRVDSTSIVGDYDLEPAPGDPSAVDVNMIGAPTVTTAGVGYEFISGNCDGDVFIIGDIINSAVGGQIEGLLASGFSSSLGDPDGAGPADSPIADALETALAEISIAGPIGQALGAHLDTEITSITEQAAGLDLIADADFFATPGASASDCAVVDGAPDLANTFDVPGALPALGSTTPGGSPYGLGLMISASAFNQLLGATTECGALNSDVTEFPFGPNTVPITSTLLATFIPEFGTRLPPATPLAIRVTPTVAPFLTDQPGANGELGELILANLHLEIIEDRAGVGEISWLKLGMDAPLGFDLTYDSVNSVLAPTITSPPPSEVEARLIRNAIKTNEAAVEALFPNLFPLFADSLGSTFSAFPLPSFLGLDLSVIEVARHDNHFVLYSSLDPVLKTRIENVSVTDQSTPDSVLDGAFNVHEWRHDIRTRVSSSAVEVDFKGMLGADACCTVDDASKSATAAFTVNLDVVPENGETWNLDVDHLINGAHTLLDEHVALEYGGGESRFTTNITARAKVGGGAWQSFDAVPSGGSIDQNPCWNTFWNNCSSTLNNEYKPFSGSNGVVLSGTTAETVSIEFSYSMYTFSDSNVVGPAVGGDEVSLRFGAHDTIANGYTAGGYPGPYNRNMSADGHFVDVILTSIP